jgi:hypothetical protein
MSLLKSLANSLEEEKEVEEKKQRQLATNPSSVLFTSNLPIIKSDVPKSNATEELIKFCHGFDDIQNKETNVQANMSSWFMHEQNEEFMKLCDYAVHLATENSPNKVFLMPYDCWTASYTKGDWTKPHDHWPSIWSWVYNVDCCDSCAPLVFPDAKQEVIPEKNTMIMFPGWVKHSVPKHQCDHERIVIAGNLGLNPYWMTNRFKFKGQVVGKKYELIGHSAYSEMKKQTVTPL